MRKHRPAIIRVATEQDQAFIDDMNLTAGFGFTRHELDYPDKDEFFAEHPEFAAFSSEFGRDGDLGLIAMDQEGDPVGAVWGRGLDRSEEDGVLADHPFEMFLGVRQVERSRGVGRQLLRSFILVATIEGIDEISLSVNPESFACELYQDFGFEPIFNDDGTLAQVGGKFVPFVPMIKKL